jgi:hypothetical protein
MAKLRVEVRVGAGVHGYSLYVDGLPASMAPGHRGEAICTGRCGDGSSHALLYSFIGAPGSTLTVTLLCAARVVCRLGELRIGDGGPPWRAGREAFAI